MAKTLKWTKECPKKPGVYWRRTMGTNEKSGLWQVFQYASPTKGVMSMRVRQYNDTKTGWELEDFCKKDWNESIEWAGPVNPPTN